MNKNLLKGLFLLLISISLTNLKALPPETQYTGRVSLSEICNDCQDGAHEIGFSFSFFGNIYTEFYTTSNGLLMFGSGSTAHTNVAIPNTSTPNNFIAPFWDDLSLVEHSTIYYQTIGVAPNRKLVVQWTNMFFSDDVSPFGTFTCILYETTNKIKMQYRSIVDKSDEQSTGRYATIGLENIDGTVGVQYSNNTAGSIAEGMAILWSPNGAAYDAPDNTVIYENIVLVESIASPEPGIPTLISPASGSTLGSDVTFSWNEVSDVESYGVVIWEGSEVITIDNADYYSAGTNLFYEMSGLTVENNYTWAVLAENTTGQSLSELRSFTVSATPPLAAVPYTNWVEEGQEIVVTMNYTGGDESEKTCQITSLPSGTLYQYDNGAHGTEITTIPTEVTDDNFRVIYVANGTTGYNAGDFDFDFQDDTYSATEETQTIHVSPLTAPNLLSVSYTSSTLEMKFDRKMAAPAGTAGFSATLVDGGVGSPVDNTITSVNLKTGDPYVIVANLIDAQTSDDIMTISYDNALGDITSFSGGELASCSAEATLQAQELSFITIPEKTYGDPNFSLSATATSGLTVTFKSSNTSILSISGSTATINKAGDVTITALQAGDDTYEYAQSIQTITVAKVVSEITELPIAADIVEGDSISESSLSGGITMFEEDIVGGSFKFAYPDSIPPSGDYYTTVIFIPINVNYSNVTIVIPINVLVDTDGDGKPNINDDDDDGDGVLDVDDAFPLDPSEDTDTDGDGVGDNNDAFPDDASEDTDSDGDGVGDNSDAFPNNPNEDTDTDNDGIGNNEDTDDDGDKTPDNEDAFPLDATEDTDTDGDEIGDNSDPDDDNDELTDLEEHNLGTDRTNPDTDGDNHGDAVDAFPLNAQEWLDTDGDQIGNNADTDDDNDRLSDDEEETLGTDPLLPDTDGDRHNDADDAFPTDATEWLDTDGDQRGNNADTDDDNDGLSDDEEETLGTDPLLPDTDGDGYDDNNDAFPTDATEWLDTDGDGTGDNSDAFPNDASEDTDTDGDGVGDNSDAFPNDATEDTDTDDDGVGDNSDAFPNDATEDTDTDGDGTGDNSDAFPNDANENTDTDNDGTGNNEDLDDDGDGVNDNEDDFPLNPNETVDTDGDGTGNNADTDDDGDGVNDDEDDFPFDNTETTDSDGDGVGDNSDAFPNDATEDTDTDGDGTGDNSDAFPNNATEDTDTDGDGTGNNADIDDDNDSIIDAEDAFPLDNTESKDTDNDGIGNNADTDDDGDGVADDEDAFPLNPNETVDTDGDGIGNNADTDDDGDSVIDAEDDLPLDPNETIDTDNDGIGNNADTDDDNDGVVDAEDAYPLDPNRYTDIDINSLTSLKVYPNPVEDFLIISTESDVIERIWLYDITGKIYIDQEINEDKYVIDVTKFRHGVYTIIAETNKGKAIYKIVKK